MEMRLLEIRLGGSPLRWMGGEGRAWDYFGDSFGAASTLVFPHTNQKNLKFCENVFLILSCVGMDVK